MCTLISSRVTCFVDGCRRELGGICTSSSFLSMKSLGADNLLIGIFDWRCSRGISALHFFTWVRKYCVSFFLACKACGVSFSETADLQSTAQRSLSRSPLLVTSLGFYLAILWLCVFSLSLCSCSLVILSGSSGLSGSRDGLSRIAGFSPEDDV